MPIWRYTNYNTRSRSTSYQFILVVCITYVHIYEPITVSNCVYENFSQKIKTKPKIPLDISIIGIGYLHNIAMIENEEISPILI